jgi:hypothetical protein
MQIIRADNLHVKKEIGEESFHRQQEKGGKDIVDIGDNAECPECSKIGRVVWVSKDGVTVGIRCSASHSLTNRSTSRLGATVSAHSKTSRNVVFLTELK